MNKVRLNTLTFSKPRGYGSTWKMDSPKYNEAPIVRRKVSKVWRKVRRKGGGEGREGIGRNKGRKRRRERGEAEMDFGRDGGKRSTERGKVKGDEAWTEGRWREGRRRGKKRHWMK